MQSRFKGGHACPLDRFSSEFRNALMQRYGRLPSAPFVAREFNLRHRGGRGISSESVRRWLQGDCLPQINRLQTLAGWLGLRVDHIFLDRPQAGASAFNHHRSSDKASLPAVRRPDVSDSVTDARPRLELSTEQRECLIRLLTLMFPDLNSTDLFREAQRDSGRDACYP